MARRFIFLLGCLVTLSLGVSVVVHAEIAPLVPVRYVESIVTDVEELKLRYPSFVRIESTLNEVYVIDGRSRVLIYTHDLYPLFTMDKGDGVEVPYGLAIDDDGYVYVAQGPRKEDRRPKISVYNPILRWERDIYLEGFEDAGSFQPHKMAFDGEGNLLVAGGYKGVLVLDRAGKYLEMMYPGENNKKVTITNVQFINDKLYMISEAAGRIYVYDRNRTFLFAFGQKGGGAGYLSRPQSVAVDSTGRIFVSDYMRHVVSAYDSDGQYIFEFGGMGWGPGWFQFPKEIAIDKEDRILVTDVFNNRVQVFRMLSAEEIAAIKARQLAKKKLPLPQYMLDIKKLIPVSDLDIGIGGKDDVSLKLKVPIPSDDTSFGPGLPGRIKGPGAHLRKDIGIPGSTPESDRTSPSLDLGPLSMNATEPPYVWGEGTSSPE